MLQAFAALAALSTMLRSVLLVGGVGLAAIAAIDWAARTRRISPFGGAARFTRTQVDPRLASIERQVVRAGGHPSATPWWALVAYAILASLLLAGVDMLLGFVRDLAYATTGGGGGLAALIVHWIFRFFSVALLVRVLSTWFPQAAGSPWIRWSFGATEWMLRPLRRLIPSFGMIDVTPIVAYFALSILESLLASVLFRGT